MKLTRLSLTNFRNFSRLDVDVPAGTVLILGNNAQGKTSLLEAVYFLAALTSFQAENDRHTINLIENRKRLAVGRVVAEFTRGGTAHSLEVRIIKETTRAGVERGRKEFILDGVKKKPRDIFGQFNAVLFLPQMMQVIEGSPEKRRRYVDIAISQTNPAYAENLSEYNKVRSQRNALLRQLFERGGDSEQLAFWDQRLVKRGAAIIQTRIQAIQEIERLAQLTHHDLTRGKESLRLSYQPAFDPVDKPANQMALMDAPLDRSGKTLNEIEESFTKALENIRAEEIRRGTTTLGPHRDEIRFLSNGMDLGIYGSRGQVRTAMLSMKLAEIDWMQEKTGYWPLLLLDEVMAELDELRRGDLLARVSESSQALMTTTDLNLFNNEIVQNWQLWRVDAGVLNPVSQEE